MRGDWPSGSVIMFALLKKYRRPLAGRVVGLRVDRVVVLEVAAGAVERRLDAGVKPMAGCASQSWKLLT